MARLRTFFVLTGGNVRDAAPVGGGGDPGGGRRGAGETLTFFDVGSPQSDIFEIVDNWGRASSMRWRGTTR